MIKKKLIIILMLLTFNNCGFKVVNKDNLYNFSVINVDVNGDNKIGFYLKNNLLNNNKQGKEINLNINIEKKKDIKEKNIKNEITKYEIVIKAKVNYDILFHNKKGHFTVTKIGNYNVESQYSQTLINEDNLIDDLREKLTEDVQENLSVLTNDL
tara:strand:+ start:344 stop:808 length:465 start_codon:yes stop_codon:yes gene_type:complete